MKQRRLLLSKGGLSFYFWIIARMTNNLCYQLTQNLVEKWRFLHGFVECKYALGKCLSLSSTWFNYVTFMFLSRIRTSSIKRSLMLLSPNCGFKATYSSYLLQHQILATFKGSIENSFPYFSFFTVKFDGWCPNAKLITLIDPYTPSILVSVESNHNL